jgi:phosphoribosylaminoimidazole (AIR) synthetase
MILIVRNSAEEQVLAMLRSKGEKPVILGSVVKGTGKVILS